MALDENDLKQIGELITTAVSAATDKLSQDADAARRGLAAKLRAEIKDVVPSPTPTPDPPAPPAPDPNDKLTLKSLQTQLQQVTSQLDAERTAAQNAQISQGIMRAATEQNMLQPGIVTELMLKRHQLAIENGQVFATVGENVYPIDRVLKDFSGTEEGKLFVPAPGARGAGINLPANTPPKLDDGEKLDAKRAVGAAFSVQNIKDF